MSERRVSSPGCMVKWDQLQSKDSHKKHKTSRETKHVRPLTDTKGGMRDREEGCKANNKAIL